MMEGRRDLVDREELRRRLARHGFVAGYIVVDTLNEMDAVECPRGWTRDEVLAELDADPDAVCEWLNPWSGMWASQPRSWVASWVAPKAVVRDVRVVRVAPEPEWVPLTQLAGRTIEGEELPVMEVVPPSHGLKNLWRWKDRAGSSVSYVLPVNLETGQVAVRPKAAT